MIKFSRKGSPSCALNKTKSQLLNQLAQEEVKHARDALQKLYLCACFKAGANHANAALRFQLHRSLRIADYRHTAQHPFEIVSQRGIWHTFCLVSQGIAQVSLRYPFCGGGGVSRLHLARSPRGKRSEKGEGVSHPLGHVETPTTP